MSKIKLFVLSLLTLLFFSIPHVVLAHPGNTASDGCHYCRTRCDYWGVPWNQRHCHGGSSYTPPTYTYSTPTSTPRPTSTPTPRPTNTPTPKPTATPIPTFTSTPDVNGETSEDSELPKSNISPTVTSETKVAGDTSSQSFFTYGILIFLGWIIYKYRDVLKERLRRGKQ